jgi:riboflavin-specific deaminase-like protein
MFVFSNLATSLDGKIAAADRSFFPLGTAADLRELFRLRTQCDIVLFGASTLRAFKKPCGVPQAMIAKRPAKASVDRGKVTHQPANAVISSSLQGLDPEWPFFTRDGFARLLVTTDRASIRRRKLFEKSCEVITLPYDRQGMRASRILEALATRGYRRVLVEGGGQVMWDFARENLIDEYHVTLTPRILGGTEAPTLVDGAGFVPSQSLNLKLKGCRKVGSELYLTYRKTAKRG